MPRNYDNSNAFFGGQAALPRLGRCALFLALELSALVLSAGCFDADALIEEQRTVAIRTRLEEVDLGKFRVTLPLADDRDENTELGFHVFGQVANRDLEKVEAAIAEYGPEIRHRMLIAARLMTTAQLEDPELTDLRKSFVEVVNESIEDKPVQSVGFYRFTYTAHKGHGAH